MTVKFAPVLPVELYDSLDTGTYHLVQAHLLEGASENTLSYFKERGTEGRAPGMHNIILDNGAAELPEPNPNALLEMASVIHPQEVVCPDQIDDARATIDLCDRYIAACHTYCNRVLLVPQGNDIAEWLECAKELASMAMGLDIPFTLGVTKFLESHGIDLRYVALAWLEGWLVGHTFDCYAKAPPVHLLGVYSTFHEAVLIAGEFPWLRGVDTTWPYALALHNGVDTGYAQKYVLEGEDWLVGPAGPGQEVLALAEANIAMCRHSLESACR